MKTIFFVRHSKAIEHSPSIEDFDRPLIDKGIKNAHLMAKLLSQQHEKPQLIISSPAIRALHTAIIMSRELNYPYSKIMLEEKLYESSAGNYFQVIKKTSDTIHNIFLFAHNPTITEVCNLLTDASIGIDAIPTSGVVGIRFDINTWQNIDAAKGTLILFDFPKKHEDS